MIGLIWDFLKYFMDYACVIITNAKVIYIKFENI